MPFYFFTEPNYDRAFWTMVSCDEQRFLEKSSRKAHIKQAELQARVKRVKTTKLVKSVKRVKR